MQKNNICGVILASGLSKRMEKNKLLLDLDGITIFEHTLKTCKNSKLSDILVVTSYDEIAKICSANSVKFTINKYSHLGQSESIKIGVKYFENSDAIMFITADTPFLKTETINLMILKYKNEILVPYFNEKPQNPVIFPKSKFSELLELQGDVGGKKIIQSNNFDKISIDYINKDIDTFDDYKSIIRGF